MILDGLGVAPKSPGNAVSLANPHNLSKLWETYPRTYLEASGEAVGLLKDTSGNSEVGHLTIGSGKIHYQNLLKINNAIKKEIFFFNKTLKNLLSHSQKNNSKIHLMGCLSDGSVHSHIDHFIAVLKFLHRENFRGEVLIHAFTDGRDTPQKAAKKYLQILEEKINEYKLGRIASICGRAYAMDRNNVMHRTQRAANLLLKGEGEHFKDWRVAIDKAYEKVESDEYIEPICIYNQNPNESTINNNDAILFMNFRPDRAVQISRTITGSDLKNVFFAGMVEYEKGYPENVLFPKEYLSLPLGRIISEAGLRQLRIAESEKFPHVTYFFNGGQPIQYQGEDREIVPSPNVITYDLQPEMSAYRVFEGLKKAMLRGSKGYQFIVVNIANCDMVGHTGNLEAAIKAVNVVDDVTMRTVKLAQAFGWVTIITTDHGNVERMIETTTQLPNTEHTQNPVPFLIIDEQIKKTVPRQLRLGTLSDVAPTILKIMGIEKPGNITGRSLI
jgi:2,3-bisphosphoglycerate-independent phosphoglycerate mutase